MGNVHFFTGLLCGAVWNLANLWCLHRALTVWLSGTAPTRRTVAWFLLKFPLLYAAAIFLLMRPGVSPVGFGVGFTATLIAATVLVLMTARTGSPFASTHGR